MRLLISIVSLILCLSWPVSTKLQNRLFELSSNGHWKGEQPSEGKFTLDNKTSKISTQVVSNFSPYNVMYDLNLKNVSVLPGDIFYFEIERFGEKSAIGWVLEEEFWPGYTGRGMLYNNYNLINIGYLIAGDFTKNIGSYGKVGTLLERKENSVEVYFYHNGRCLGCGFKLTDSKYLDKVWHPCISLTGNQTMRYIFPKSVPTQREREDIPSNDPYKGDWNLVRVKEVNSSQEIPLITKVSVNLDRDDITDQKISFNFRVVNTHRGSMLLKGGPKTDGSFEGVTVNGFMSTLIGGPRDKMSFESEMSKLLGKVTHIKRLDEDQNNSLKILLMKGPNVEIELQEKPQEIFQPVGYYTH